MKKTVYIQPLTYVVTIKTNGQLLQAASPNKIIDDGDKTYVIIDPDKMGEGGNGSDAASRRTIWDDEEDF